MRRSTLVPNHADFVLSELARILEGKDAIVRHGEGGYQAKRVPVSSVGVPSFQLTEQQGRDVLEIRLEGEEPLVFRSSRGRHDLSVLLGDDGGIVIFHMVATSDPEGTAYTSAYTTFFS